jgi:hypothetical protein
VVPLGAERALTMAVVVGAVQEESIATVCVKIERLSMRVSLFPA